MSLFEFVRRNISPKDVFYTPKRKCPFRVSFEDGKTFFFKIDNHKSFSTIPRICWDRMPDFLRGKGWVIMGEKFDVASQGSLQEFLDTFHGDGKSHSSEASHVASILEYLKIVAIDRGRPLKVKLVADAH